MKPFLLPTSHCPLLLSDDTITRLLSWRWTSWWRIDVLSTPRVRVLRLLQLHALLLSTEITLIRATVVTLTIISLVGGRRVRRCGSGIPIVLLRWSASILRWSVTWWGRTRCPSCSSPWLLTLTAATSSCYAAECEKDEEGADNEGTEDNPSSTVSKVHGEEV